MRNLYFRCLVRDMAWFKKFGSNKHNTLFQVSKSPPKNVGNVSDFTFVHLKIEEEKNSFYLYIF